MVLVDHTGPKPRGGYSKVSSDLQEDVFGHQWLNKLDDRLPSDECLRCHFQWANVSDRTCVSWMRDLRGLRADLLVVKRTDGQAGPAFAPVSYAGDCGLDLALSHEVSIGYGHSVNAACGVAVALPPGTFGWITGRSSTWSRHGIQVMPGIIDEGWRGELRAMLYRPIQTLQPQSYPMPDVLHLPAGTRVAQLIVMTSVLPTVRMIQVPDGIELPDGSRGTNGFGSSGD